MDKIRVYIESSLIPRTQVRPLLSGSFGYERESGKIYYRHTSKDAFKFTDKADYDALLNQRENECETVLLTLERRCNGQYVEYWKGTFSVFTSVFNYTKCWVETKPKPDDGYQCLEDALKEDYNVFAAGPVTSVSAVSESTGNYETETCVRFTSDETEFSTWDDNYACPAVDPTEWCVRSDETTGTPSFDQNDNPVTEYEQTTVWHREVATTDCVDGTPVEPPYSGGWMLLEDNCGVDSTATWWRCPGSVGGELAGPYDRGRLFSDVVQDVVASFGCGLTVKSDFFGINPAGDAPDNGAYQYAAANLRSMTMHQKSDIKRRNDTNGSTFEAWEFKGEDFFNDLLRWFNVFYDIEDGVLILEHYSFFTSAIGLDLSGEAMEKQVDYSGNENVRTQKYYFADEASSPAFMPVKITYDCGEEEKDEPLRLFSADLLYIQNPTYSENIADEGFVLIANDLYEGDLVIKNNNEPLAWRTILPALHQWGRLYKSGSIGGATSTPFESWLPYIKQQPFKTDLCCGQDFNPQDLITTDLGNGAVTDATHNLFTGRLEIELSY